MRNTWTCSVSRRIPCVERAGATELMSQIDTLHAALFLDYASQTRHIRRDTMRRHRAGLETLRKRLYDAGDVQLRSEREVLFNRLIVLVIARALPNGPSGTAKSAVIANAVELDADDAAPVRPSSAITPAVVGLANAVVSVFTAGEPMAAAPALDSLLTVDATLAALAGVVASWQ